MVGCVQWLSMADVSSGFVYSKNDICVSRIIRLHDMSPFFIIPFGSLTSNNHGDDMTLKLSALTRHLLLGALTFGIAATAHSQSYPAAVQKHLDAATTNAAGDQDLINYIRRNSCFEVEDSTWRTWARAQDSEKVSLLQLFDDLWFAGTKYTGMYFLKTADGGLLLIDALNNTADANEVIIPAIQKLNLPIRGIYISHGHIDHDGGVNRLREVYGYGFPVYLGSADIPSKTYQPTPIDSNNPAVQSVTIGGTTIQVQAAPGHTPGNQTSLIPVHHKGQKQLLVMNWRSAVPGSAEGSKQYVTGIERVYKMARDYGAVGFIHTHSISDATLPTINAIEKTGSRDTIPLFFGAPRTARAAVVARECSVARAQQIDATASFPVWRVSTLKFVEEKPTFDKVSAKLESGWGPVVGQHVRFKVDGQELSCTAPTNSSGEASCALPAYVMGGSKVVAEYAGTESAAFVDLPSSAQVVLAEPEGSGGCAMVGNGRFDPILLGLALLGAFGVWRRRKALRG